MTSRDHRRAARAAITTAINTTRLAANHQPEPIRREELEWTITQLETARRNIPR